MKIRVLPICVWQSSQDNAPVLMAWTELWDAPWGDKGDQSSWASEKLAPEELQCLHRLRGSRARPWQELPNLVEHEPEPGSAHIPGLVASTNIYNEVESS